MLKLIRVVIQRFRVWYKNYIDDIEEMSVACINDDEKQRIKDDIPEKLRNARLAQKYIIPASVTFAMFIVSVWAFKVVNINWGECCMFLGALAGICYYAYNDAARIEQLCQRIGVDTEGYKEEM
jgi:hypothetical protein